MNDNNDRSGSNRESKGGYNKSSGYKGNNRSSDNRFSSDRRSGGFNNRGGSSSGPRKFDSDRPRQTFKVICSDCNKECEVPFKPTQGRDVYCRDCFAKHKPAFK